MRIRISSPCFFFFSDGCPIVRLLFFVRGIEELEAVGRLWAEWGARVFCAEGTALSYVRQVVMPNVALFLAKKGSVRIFCRTFATVMTPGVDLFVKRNCYEKNFF
jgi:hypothetical protein